MAKRPLWPQTYLGFPAAWPAEQESSSPGVARRRGIAMIIAIMVIAMLLVFTSDMIVNSTVNIQLTESGRDGIKAEYMAKSAANLGIFLIGIDWAVDLTKFMMNSAVLPTDGEGASDIYSQLNDKPIGGKIAEMMGLSKVNDSAVYEQMKFFDDGVFQVNVTDELSRINVNYCGLGRGLDCRAMVELLLNGPAERTFLEKKKTNAKEISANIRSWVAVNKTGDDESSSADPYGSRMPRVGPKHAPFDSLDELRMVAGWDDDLHTVYSPYLTVYPPPIEGKLFEPMLNINSVPEELMRSLMPEGAGNCPEQFTKYFNPPEGQLRGQATKRGEIEQTLASRFCVSDPNKLKWFTFRSDVFRIRAMGAVRRSVKGIELVVQRTMPDLTALAGESNAETKATNKILYWKFSDPRPEDEQIIQEFSQDVPNVYGRGHKPYMENVISALKADGQALVEGPEGRKDIEILTALYESAACNGKAVAPGCRIVKSKLGKANKKAA